MKNLVVAAMAAGLACAACQRGLIERSETGETETVDTSIDWDTVFGIVAEANDVVCLRTLAKAGTVPRRIPVTIPTSGQWLVATLGDPLASCPGDVSGLDAVFHRLAVAWEPGDLGIAVIKGDPDQRLFDLDGDGTYDSFRACTSHEGVHLSVWSGAALTGRRLWQDYYYLGYDVEPTCVEEDFAGLDAHGV